MITAESFREMITGADGVLETAKVKMPWIDPSLFQVSLSSEGLGNRDERGSYVITMDNAKPHIGHYNLHLLNHHCNSKGILSLSKV